MIPEDIIITESKQNLQPSLTYKIDHKKNKIAGITDELEAVKQAVFLVLITERDYSEIYQDYGIKTADLIGQEFSFVSSELKRRIRETLIEDDRIEEVENFTFSDSEDGLLVGFDVITIYGSFYEQEVYKI